MPRVRNKELTERQQAILRMIADGKTNGEIAESLGISLDGAKYHVSEIITKLGVESREDAAEWWRAHRKPRHRLGRVLRSAVALGSWKLAGGAAILCAFSGVALALVLLGSGGEQRAEQLTPTATGVTATPSLSQPTLAPTPASKPTLAPTPPDGPIAFRVCDSATGWAKPDPEHMSAFTDSRYSDGVRPPVWGWTTYLSNFLAFIGPWSAALNQPTFDFSGRTEADWARTQSACTQGASRSDGLQEAAFFDYVPTRMQSVQGRLDVTVVPRDGSFEAAVFPDPPVSGAQVRFTSMVVRDDAGRLLCSMSDAGVVAYDRTGKFEFASLPRPGAPLVIPVAEATNVDVFASWPPLPPGTATLIKRDASGSEVQRLPIESGPDEWIPLATLQLGPGTFSLEIEALTPNVSLTLLSSASPRPQAEK